MLDLMLLNAWMVRNLTVREYVHYLILEILFVAKELLCIVTLKLDISICIVNT